VVAEVQEDQQSRPEVNSNDSLLSLNDLAQYLSCSRSYAAMLIAEGTIPSFKIGSLRRVRRSDLDAYIETRLAAKG
jgi:excisionase family DNA binding protein